MRILGLVLVPALGGITAFLLRSSGMRRGLLVVVALAHGILTASAWAERPAPALGGGLALDSVGLLFLSVTSVLFLATAGYAVGYLRRELRAPKTDIEEGLLFTDAPEAVFVGCLLLFLAAMTLVTVSHHFGLLWIGVDATTLASAPLIYVHRHHRSLEATWKYLLVCSVGIALALLGNFFLGVAGAGPNGRSVPIVLEHLVASAGELRTPWLKAAFIFILVGYGTKMGLAPLHTWLPDAHSEAPSVVSGLLSGALLNCAFLAILRGHQVCVAAGLAPFARELLLGLGLLSLAVAAVFILGQTDYKRLLAYSSVEHMGILALGVGLGGGGAFGAMLHTVNHSLTKGWLFLVAGNILTAYQTKSILRVQGVQQRLPVSGLLWIGGLLAITGTPPFGPFLSELTILKAALDEGHGLVAAVYLGLLALIFMGMSSAMLGMAQGGRTAAAATPRASEALSAVGPPAALGLVVLGLGVYVPSVLDRLLHDAARILGGS